MSKTRNITREELDIMNGRGTVVGLLIVFIPSRASRFEAS